MLCWLYNNIADSKYDNVRILSLILYVLLEKSRKKFPQIALVIYYNWPVLANFQKYSSALLVTLTYNTENPPGENIQQSALQKRDICQTSKFSLLIKISSRFSESRASSYFLGNAPAHKKERNSSLVVYIRQEFFQGCVLEGCQQRPSTIQCQIEMVC